MHLVAFSFSSLCLAARRTPCAKHGSSHGASNRGTQSQQTSLLHRSSPAATDRLIAFPCADLSCHRRKSWNITWPAHRTASSMRFASGLVRSLVCDALGFAELWRVTRTRVICSRSRGALSQPKLKYAVPVSATGSLYCADTGLHA